MRHHRQGHASGVSLLRLTSVFTACVLIAGWTLSLALPSHAAGAAPQKGPTRTVLGLSQEKMPDGVAVIVKGDGHMDRYVSTPMSDPPRLVIDFPGAIFPGAANAYQSPDESIKKVRVGRHKPDMLRIVFDFKGREVLPYRIVEDDNFLRIEFVTRKEANSTPAAKIVQPNGSLTVILGDSVTFEGSVSGGNEPVMSEWTLTGNGITEINPGPPSRKFDQEGAYTVTFRVTDRDGETSADSITVTVKAPPASTPEPAPAAPAETQGAPAPATDAPAGTGTSPAPAAAP